MLASLAQTPTPPAGEQRFSEVFRRRRAWEREQAQPSWKDRIAVAGSAFGGAQIFGGATPVLAVPSLGLDLEVWAHLWPELALVGAGQIRVAFLGPGVEAVIPGLGAGVRLGARHFATLSGGAAFVTLTRVTSTARSGLVPSFELRGAVILVGKLGVHFRLGLLVLFDGPMVDVGVGFGLSS